MIFDMFSEKCELWLFSESVYDLMQEVVELCTKSRADRSELLQESPALVEKMERPFQSQG